MSSRIEQLQALFITALGADDEDHALYQRVFFGKNEIHRNHSAPRLVVYLTQGPLVTPDRVGEEKIQVGDDWVRSRIIAVRHVGINVYCHGRDNEETENLLHNSIAAWRKVAHASIGFGSESWPSEDEGGIVLHGQEAVLSLELHIPVYDIQNTLKFVTGVVDEDTWVNPDGSTENVDCKPPVEDP
jgi:hypothetical protein